jgi:hypothetical protein
MGGNRLLRGAGGGWMAAEDFSPCPTDPTDYQENNEHEASASLGRATALALGHGDSTSGQPDWLAVATAESPIVLCARPEHPGVHSVVLPLGFVAVLAGEASQQSCGPGGSLAASVLGP